MGSAHTVGPTSANSCAYPVKLCAICGAHVKPKSVDLAYKNKNLILTAKRMDGRTDVYAQIEARNILLGAALPEAQTLSDDPEARRLASEGLRMFVTRTAQRILAEYSDEIAFNNCPQCGAVARTPNARQCRFCGFDWHGNR